MIAVVVKVNFAVGSRLGILKQANVWRHFWFLQLRGVGIIGVYWGEDRSAAGHPTAHRTFPHNKESFGPKCQ